MHLEKRQSHEWITEGPDEFEKTRSGKTTGGEVKVILLTWKKAKSN